MGGSIGRIQTRGETVFFSCQEALDPDMYAEVKFNTSLFPHLPKIVGDSRHLFMAEVCPDCRHLYEHDEARMV